MYKACLIMSFDYGKFGRTKVERPATPLFNALSPTTYFCHVKFHGSLTGRYSVIVILRPDSNSIAENRLLNRLKYKSAVAHLHMAPNFITEISNL